LYAKKFDNGWNWVDDNGNQLSNKMYNETWDFENNFARFRNFKMKYGWVNTHGKEIGTLHNNVYNFKNNFAFFIDSLNAELYGYVNDLGFEYSNENFNFHPKTYDGNFYKNEKILFEMESKLLKNFPKDSLKRFILGEML